MLLWVAIVIVATILALSLRSKVHSLEKSGQVHRWPYYFSKNSLEVIIPLILVIVVYFLLLATSYYLPNFFLSLRTLVRLEQTLESLKTSFSPFKLSPIGVFLVFLGLFCLGLFRLSAETSERLHKTFKKYRTLTRRIYITLALLCSFTLFGVLPGEPTRELRLRIKSVRDGYADFREEVGKAFSLQVAEALFDNSLDSCPPPYRQALQSSAAVGGRVSHLRDRYLWAKTEFGIRSIETERAIAPFEEGRGKSPMSPPQDRQRVRRMVEAPEEISQAKLVKAREHVRRQRLPLRKAERWVKVPGAREVITQAPKIFTGEIKKIISQSLVEQYPILEPVIASLVKTANDQLEEKIGRAVDRVAKSVVEEPPSYSRIVEDELNTFMKDTKVVITPEMIKRATETARNIQNSILRVEAASSSLEAEIRRADYRRIDNLIVGLQSPNENIRETSVNKLVEYGPRLEKEHVDKLVRLMRHGDESWSSFLYRESHCRWFERVSLKYYASDALARMRCPRVTQAVVSEAESVRSKGKEKYRVTDPGWI